MVDGSTCSMKRSRELVLLETGKGAKGDDKQREPFCVLNGMKACNKHLSTKRTFTCRRLSKIKKKKESKRETFSFPHLHVQPDVSLSLVLKARY